MNIRPITPTVDGALAVASLGLVLLYHDDGIAVGVQHQVELCLFLLRLELLIEPLELSLLKHLIEDTEKCDDEGCGEDQSVEFEVTNVTLQ